jgi:hypothetical protein
MLTKNEYSIQPGKTEKPTGQRSVGFSSRYMKLLLDDATQHLE